MSFLYYRLALVAAFLVSPFGAAERAWKPFNPLLGETFELDNVGNNVRFMAEQVRVASDLATAADGGVSASCR